MPIDAQYFVPIDLRRAEYTKSSQITKTIKLTVCVCFLNTCSNVKYFHFIPEIILVEIFSNWLPEFCINRAVLYEEQRPCPFLTLIDLWRL